MGCPYVAVVAFRSYKVSSGANEGAMTDIASVAVGVVNVAGIDISSAVEALIVAAVRLVSSAQA